MLKFIVYDDGDDDVWLRTWERHDSVGGRGNDVTTIEVTNSNDQVNSDQTHGRAALSKEPPQAQNIGPSQTILTSQKTYLAESILSFQSNLWKCASLLWS